jgi:hypothetical protein
LIAEGPTARAALLRQMMESVGGKVPGYYFAEDPDFDVVALLEIPTRCGRTSLRRSPSAR